MKNKKITKCLAISWNKKCKQIEKKIIKKLAKDIGKYLKWQKL